MVIFVLSYEACEQPVNSDHNAIRPRGTPARDLLLPPLPTNKVLRRGLVAAFGDLERNYGLGNATQRLAAISVDARLCSVIQRCGRLLRAQSAVNQSVTSLPF